jgi:hypothetical protein
MGSLFRRERGSGDGPIVLASGSGARAGLPYSGDMRLLAIAFLVLGAGIAYGQGAPEPNGVCATAPAARPVDPGRVDKPSAGEQDRSLLRRFPDEASYRAARDQALEYQRSQIQESRATLAMLGAQREVLLHDSIRPEGDEMPAALKRALKANEAAIDGQRESLQAGECGLAGVESSYDGMLKELRRLWGDQEKRL